MHCGTSLSDCLSWDVDACHCCPIIEIRHQKPFRVIWHDISCPRGSGSEKGGHRWTPSGPSAACGARTSPAISASGARLGLNMLRLEKSLPFSGSLHGNALYFMKDIYRKLQTRRINIRSANAALAMCYENLWCYESAASVEVPESSRPGQVHLHQGL